MKNNPDFQIWTLYEEMETPDILSAWTDIGVAMQTLKEACENRLYKLGYYSTPYYEHIPNAEIDKLRCLVKTLASINV